MSEEPVFTGSNRLKIGVTRLPDGTLRVHPVGVVNEDVNFTEIIHNLLATGAPKAMEFDLSSVIRINSSGVRQWLMLMEQIPASIPVTFSQVPEGMIDQANLVPLFGRRGSRLVSFEAPYACEACAHAGPYLLHAADVTNARKPGKIPVPPVVECPHCKAPRFAFDGIAEEYFLFLRAQPGGGGQPAK